MRNAYTLLELLLVIGILLTLMAIGSPFLFGHKLSLEVDEEANRMTGMLRNAQNKALTLQNASAWGIHFDNTGSEPFYDLFWGLTYEVGTTTDRIYLSEGIQYGLPISGSSTTIIFAKRTGTPTAAATISLQNTLTNPPQQKTISINTLGRTTTE